MVSMKEIAKQCNVSVATVSKALNGYSDIGEETRNYILKTASEMGYLPNSSARALKTKRTFNLGVLFVDEARSGLTHDYFNHVLESFKSTAEAKGYDITFTSGNVSGKRMTYLEHCRYRGVDGVVMACVDFTAEEVQELLLSDIPVVTIDHICDGRISVVSNNIQGMEELVTYIYKKGHRKIAYIHGDDTSVTKNRLGSFYRTLQRLGIEEPVNSPTFTIVQVYEEGRLPFYHFDVYRIGDIEEMDEVGFEEYVMGEGVSLIEWANLIEEILPERRTNILIEKDLTQGFDYRRITIEEQ